MALDVTFALTGAGVFTGLCLITRCRYVRTLYNNNSMKNNTLRNAFMFSIKRQSVNIMPLAVTSLMTATTVTSHMFLSMLPDHVPMILYVFIGTGYTYCWPAAEYATTPYFGAEDTIAYDEYLKQIKSKLI